MRVHRLVLPALCALIIALALPASAQEKTDTTTTTTTAKGKLVFTFTVTIDSAIPKNGVLVCTGMASIEGYTQTAIGIVAAPVEGANKCVANMPYSWVLASAATDKISFTVKAEVDYGYEFTATNGTTTSAELASSDKVSGDLPSISVPTAATTNIAVSATI